ncbi:unnamed protein product [Nezara viridula]|uniref:Uncharacterized protein n=1 Tax=Nezara viridula TaxID=85310 RepID=A0A9P0H4D4_NEZVI|nr:unnamed protein product [Nezara viridula]
MDLIQLTQRQNEGFITNHSYSNLMHHKLLKRMHSHQSEVYQKKFSPYGADFSSLNNRLLVAHSGQHVSLYDMAKPIKAGYECMKVWEIQSTLRTGLESINWNSQGDFFTFSAKDQHLYCVDVEHMEEIDKIKIKEAHRIFQHKPSPHNPEIVAVASPLPDVVLVDLKSGNLTSTAPFHPSGVLSISWCGRNENLLGTAGDNGVIFWDIRQFRKPMYVNGDNCAISGVLPNFEIISFTDDLVVLNPDRTLTVWNAHKLHKISHCGPFNNVPYNRNVRYQFALSGTSKPGLIFMPENQDIVVYDFQTMDMTCVLQHGHIMPVQICHFSEYRYQIFSSSLDGSLAWVPKPLLWGQCWTSSVLDE